MPLWPPRSNASGWPTACPTVRSPPAGGCVRATSRRGDGPDCASPCARASGAGAVGDDVDHAVLTTSAPVAACLTEAPRIGPEHVDDLWALTATAHRQGASPGRAGRRRGGRDGRPVAEVDVYFAGLAGLCTVEAEPAPTDAAARFVTPAWFGVEVTGDDRASNAALADRGRPADP